MRQDKGGIMTLGRSRISPSAGPGAFTPRYVLDSERGAPMEKIL